MKRAVKYCGGCNPRYDRVALVRQLESRLGERLSGVWPGEVYDEVYVVCGCSARCADLSSVQAKSILVFDRQDSCPETENRMIVREKEGI